MAKYIKQKKQSKEEWFDLVVHNAVNFLKTSVDNLERSPRSAIIDLYTAIELFFKARLMKEHWTLILTKPEEANRTKFEGGDFHSVYLEQSEKRLENICGEKFRKEAMDKFKALSEHRNQIVHFAHTDFVGYESEVVIEHWASWFYLYDLLIGQWGDVFKDYKVEFEGINKKIHINRGFLNVKFEAIEGKLKIEVAKGGEVINCTSCSLESALVTEKHPWGKNFECLVCEVKDIKLKDIQTEIVCPSCDKEVKYFMQKGHTCTHCNFDVSPEYALEKYAEIYQSSDPDCRYEDGYDAIAYCHSCCSKIASVVKLEDLWVCVLCEDRGWTALDCENCDSFVTGDVERIKYFACHRCEDEVSAKYRAEFAEYEDTELQNP